MDDRLDRLQRMLQCIGDPSRFRVVTELLAGDFCVTELARQVGLSQSCTTRHLQVLEREGLVVRSRQGKKVFFRITDDENGIAPILEWAMTRTSPEGARKPVQHEARHERIDPGTYKRPSRSTAPRTTPADPPAAAPASADRELDDFLL